MLLTYPYAIYKFSKLNFYIIRILSMKLIIKNLKTQILLNIKYINIYIFLYHISYLVPLLINIKEIYAIFIW